ncbi:pirin family protein [Shimwellia blattae]|uniref:Putative pirin domain protein n=1 Tax=Shimwellia blattae (strain ATCC 29907 / DSM 4481 / JCM 1650 / NBRC 105725 / CDC 9005-74) TaxID=630626 RepID=I2BBU9_SHIBC|nr:pirin-like bicupin family protein [Shimwellia blattae]AFJ48003.1 putative pirin domain protein [Shimwellia blattae DSM 4481 = NBRC 105725]GAB82007.1 putative quercetin 2,3-dioxygenase YhhW [Shimwellia blattae DSM 4481 = NBRC 105725]VDY65503.1 Quercetin 2,3-dioxygenase [Shimwellia blattae]VEC24786.1 Quercetin 2,3-dioxygenase [Shimwellia blattae]
MATDYRLKSADSLHYLPASDYHPANTRFHFSFANYYDPDNMHYGVLRVVNDDDVKPHSGFDKHPHKDMEIVSYVVHGHLTHWDSATGVEEVLGRGDAQAITAGRGVWHSELNKHDEWCRFLQIWILPPRQGLEVRYHSHHFGEQDRENRIAHIVGSIANDDAPLQLNQDVNMYVSELTRAEARVNWTLEAGRQAYISNIEGSVDIAGLPTLQARDTLEITGPASLSFRATEQHAHFIIIEMPQWPEEA